MSRRRNQRVSPTFDLSLLIFGFLVGVLLGGIFGLLTAPRSGRATRQQMEQGLNETGENIRETLTSDPVADSIAEGKAAARRRRAELGLPDAP